MVPSHNLDELLAGDINQWRIQCHNEHNTAVPLYINKYNIPVLLHYVLSYESNFNDNNFTNLTKSQATLLNLPNRIDHVDSLYSASEF